MKKILFIIFIFLFTAFVIIVTLSNNIGKWMEKRRSDKILKEQIEKSIINFPRDSQLIMNLNNIKLEDLALCKEYYNRISKLPPQYYLRTEPIFKHLLNLSCSKTFNVEVIDRLDRTIIKTGKRQIKFTFDQYIRDTAYYKSDKIVEESFKNERNRKLDLLRGAYMWSEHETNVVARGDIEIGMTTQMVRAAWGDPNHVNTTTFAFGVHEQWVYDKFGGKYVYFEGDSQSSMKVGV
jgi:DNA-binding ferritin-like protein (Dps family)